MICGMKMLVPAPFVNDLIEMRWWSSHYSMINEYIILNTYYLKQMVQLALPQELTLRAVGAFMHQDKSNSAPIICFLTVQI